MAVNCISTCAIVVALMVASALALPAQRQEQPANEGSFWKSTLMDGTFDELRSECAQKDEIACMKYKVLSFVDQFFQKDSFKVSDNVAVVKNSFADDQSAEARSASGDFIDRVENYVQSHDVTLALPGSTITLSPRNLDQDEINLSFDFGQDRAVEEGRRNKLKKIMIPIMIFILLKAMTLIPFFIGVLGLKAWNALQLSFFSFVISVALAVFQLCKKIAHDSAHPIVTAHNPWDAAAAHYKARSMEAGDAQTLAYRAHQA